MGSKMDSTVVSLPCFYMLMLKHHYNNIEEEKENEMNSGSFLWQNKCHRINDLMQFCSGMDV